MAWRIAESLQVLLAQINKLAPYRSKLSDGSIGDAAHASRNSDHNPWVMDGKVGIVTARDCTHDPKGGFDAYNFAETLRLNKDARIKYVISNRRIFSGSSEDHPAFEWRPYSGKNPHDHHTHVSVKPDKAHYDDRTEWNLRGFRDGQARSSPIMRLPLLKKGDTGESVRLLQRLLTAAGYDTKGTDGIFGAGTAKAAIDFQRAHGLVPDARIGAYTWVALSPPIIATDVSKAKEQETWFSSPFPGPDDYGIAWGKTFERFSAEAYADPTWDAAAQGYGHNAKSGVPPIPVKDGPAWTETYASQVYAADLALFGRWLNYYVKVPLTQDHVNALVLDMFKYGPTKWSTDNPATDWKENEVMLCLNAGDYKGAGEALRNRPHVLKGVRRRYGVLADIFEGKRPSTTTW